MPDVWHCCTTLLIRIFLRALTAKVNICGNAKAAHSVQRILATALATYISTLRLAYLCAFIFISLNASDVFVRRKCLFALAWLYELLINRQRDVNVKRFLLTRACGAFFVARPATLSAISPNKPHRQPRTSGPPTICLFVCPSVCATLFSTLTCHTTTLGIRFLAAGHQSSSEPAKSTTQTDAPLPTSLSPHTQTNTKDARTQHPHLLPTWLLQLLL